MSSAAYRTWQAWRYLGPRWLAYRLSYAARLRTGALRRRIPALDWAAQPLAQFLRDPQLADPGSYLTYQRSQLAPAFFFAAAQRQAYQRCFANWDGGPTTPLGVSAELVQGKLRYFEHTSADIGFPPDWHTNSFTGQRSPADQHWSEIDDFGQGDIKVIWEPSRFSFVYALVRAYWRTGDERYAEIFWELVEDWREHNPPQLGLNWKCGQETSFRVMAWCFGLYGFLHAEMTSPGRVAALAQMIAVSGRRVAANLEYALSQRNNHGISEAVGLWTIGVLFPELRLAEQWRNQGRQVLEALGRELIYADGAFVQHSMNYHRLMLHDYVWALRLGELQGSPFSDLLKARVGQAADFLYQAQDVASGHVPNYGHNDGALILPLNNCDYRDFRPVIQAARYLCTQTRCYGDGPWDEDLLWLFGSDATHAPIEAAKRSDLQADIGGYYTLRADTGFAFVRCANFRDRPSQADMLHVDLWWRGQNIALDAGTYSYNAPDPWNNALASTRYHNTVTVDDLDQMDKAGKFLWLPWLRARVRNHMRSSSGILAYWEGEHNGYQRLKSPVSHRRSVLKLGNEHWLVLDALDGRATHRYRLHWLAADLPYEWDSDSGSVKLHTPAGDYYMQMSTPTPACMHTLIRADAHSPRGWWSAYYNVREPALSVDLVAQADSVFFWTLFGPQKGNVNLDGSTLQVETEQWHAQLALSFNDQHPLIESVFIAGQLEDKLHLPA
jgi:hypothetical protein